MSRIKLIMIMVSLLLLGNVSFAGQLDVDTTIDTKVGENFRGIAWGADISTIQGMRKTETTLEGIDTYARDGDDLKFDGITFKNIEYGFYKGKFMSVSLFSKGKEDWSALKNFAFEKYGARTEILEGDETLEQYLWQGRYTNISLMYDQSRDEGWLTIIKGLNGYNE